MNKFFGIILYIIGSLFILAFIGQLTKFIGAIVGLTKIFSSNVDSSQIGYLFGMILYWILHFAIIYFSFKYGTKLFKKKQKQS